jgi:lipoprotein-anchoring transpeptidase ErfK/SrfK
VTPLLSRLAAIFSLLVLAACGAPTDVTEDVRTTLPGYEAVQDGEFFIPQVDKKFLWGGQPRQEVEYLGDEAPGSIVVDTFARKLYFVQEGNRAMRYAIAVGREGLRFTGTGVIGRKAEWPSWQPTANMIRTRPDLYREYASGLPGGLDNPLGARAMYLYGGRDSYFRIHGTIDDASIGHATSAGCIRLFNQDAMDLYERVEPGARVKVRSLDESLAAEGAFIDDAYGRAIPDTEANRLQVEADKITVAAEDAAAAEQAIKDAADAEILAVKEAALAAKEAVKLARERAWDCKRLGLIGLDCPAPDLPLPDQLATN